MSGRKLLTGAGVISVIMVAVTVTLLFRSVSPSSSSPLMGVGATLHISGRHTLTVWRRSGQASVLDFNAGQGLVRLSGRTVLLSPGDGIVRRTTFSKMSDAWRSIYRLLGVTRRQIAAALAHGQTQLVPAYAAPAESSTQTPESETTTFMDFSTDVPGLATYVSHPLQWCGPTVLGLPVIDAQSASDANRVDGASSGTIITYGDDTRTITINSSLASDAEGSSNLPMINQDSPDYQQNGLTATLADSTDLIGIDGNNVVVISTSWPATDQDWQEILAAFSAV